MFALLLLIHCVAHGGTAARFLRQVVVSLIDIFLILWRRSEASLLIRLVCFDNLLHRHLIWLLLICHRVLLDAHPIQHALVLGVDQAHFIHVRHQIVHFGLLLRPVLSLAALLLLLFGYA